MVKHDYRPIRQWQCVAAIGCEQTTQDWYKDGWLITGSAQSEFRDVAVSKVIEVVEDGKLKSRIILRDDRGVLEDAGLIESTDLSVALICPDHAPQMVAHLEKLRNPQQAVNGEKQEDTGASGLT